MRPFRLRATVAIVGLSCSTLGPSSSSAVPTDADAERVFDEARLICERDGGKLWGVSLCGPILLVDATDQAVVANQADRDGRLARAGAVFRGVLPDDVIVANTPTEWAGVRWTQIDGPVPDDAQKRHVLLAHELFHRIQPRLRLTRPEAGNGHLDTQEGRTLMQLEWRALARAIAAPTVLERRQAVADALALRRVRYRRFTDAAGDEGALEINEGIAEYTGVMLGLATDRERVAYAVHDLSAFVSAPTFVRSFAYATGSAYGLLLDRAAPGWRRRIGARRFDELLGDAMRVSSATDAPIAPIEARYDPDGSLRASETHREEERRARLAAYRAQLVDGPVLVLPLNRSNFQFNPQTLVGFDDAGTIYPTLRLTDDWGSLEVARGGALVRGAMHVATVTARGVDAAGPTGDGWQLKLNAGWTVRAGSRPGDFAVVPSQP